MGLLDGRKALIFGVANDHSIAWGIAQALHAEGAEVGFSSVESLIDKRVRPLAESIGSTFVEPCDVASDDQIRASSRAGARPTTPSTSSSTPSPSPGARSSRRLRRHVSGRVRARPRHLRLFAHRARPRGAAVPPRGSSVITLTYYGSEKVVANYNVMGVAKAALEASVRYSPRTRPRRHPGQCDQRRPDPHPAASGIAGFKGMYRGFAESPLCGPTSSPRTSAAARLPRLGP